VVRTHLEGLDHLSEQRAELDKKIDEIAHSDTYWGRVQRLMSLKGVGIYSAMVLVTEIGDIRRFGEAPRLMSYMGLVPGESSSGEKRRTKSITKAGNSRLRWVMAEMAWNQMRKVGGCVRVRKHWETQPAEVVAIGRRAEKRLHDKFWKVALRKDKKTAAIAVAREMAGFVWAMLRLEVA
jgi:transposase